ncbi:MAG: hypothetical protein IJJ99_08985 [Oscillospiraceae bacterium]|nr:hypothetical protein [Oscillospiraceae bacterium]
MPELHCSSAAPAPQGARVTENVYLCGDGKYRWVYEMPILKNPTIFLLVWKIFFFIILGIFVVSSVFDAVEWSNEIGERLLSNLKIFGYFILGMTVIVVISMLVYAAIMGGKYVVVFEMDENGVNHKQLPKQAKKAQAIGAITALVGLASGNFSTAGAGMLSAARTEMYSEFARVRKVKACPRRHLIKVNQRLYKNQVYADPADFDFVLNFIRAHVPNR